MAWAKERAEVELEALMRDPDPNTFITLRLRSREIDRWRRIFPRLEFTPGEHHDATGRYLCTITKKAESAA